MGDPEAEFEWIDPEELRAATDEELIEHVQTLQEHVHTLQEDYDDLRELVYLLLDLRIGAAEEFHPELGVLLDELDRSSSSSEAIEAETESD